jgi:hypothetical protein
MFYGLAAKLGGIALAVVLIFGLGYGMAWRGSQVEIGKLQGAIQASNAMSAKILADEKVKAEASIKAQKESAVKLQEKYNDLTKSNSNAADELNAARVRYNAANKPGDSCTAGKDSDTSGNSKDDERGRIVDPTSISEGIDRIIQRKAPRADQIDIDKHAILEWLRSLPPELIAK